MLNDFGAHSDDCGVQKRPVSGVQFQFLIASIVHPLLVINIHLQLKHI